MKKRILALLMANCLIFALAACGGAPTDSNGSPDDDSKPAGKSEQENVQLTEYTAPSGTFAVSMPEISGGWTQSEEGNEYHLVLDNSDKSFTLMLQALPLEQAQVTYPDLDALIAFYNQNTLSSFGEPKATEVTIGDPAIAGVTANTYTAEKNGMTAKAMVAFFQTEKAYYICILTGSGEAFDTNIDSAQKALTTFTEKGE